MTWRTRVVCSEGMLLQPQHLQQSGITQFILDVDGQRVKNAHGPVEFACPEGL
jgi:predicted component of type VI protein secretion system